MASCYGPCSLPGRACLEGYLPCYEDCCKRGEWFCNNDKNEQRCQDCHLRRDQCGTNAMPHECDVYCHKIFKSDVSGQVSPAYIASTIGLGVGVGVLLLVLLVVLLVHWIWPAIKRLRQRRNLKNSIPSSSMLESDQLSLIESTVSGGSREEKGVQTDTAAADQDPGMEATTTATTPLLPPQSPLPHPPTVCHDQSSLPLTQTPPSSGQNPPRPHTPGQTRLPEAPPQNVQPAEDLQRRGGEGNPGHTRPAEDPHARHNPRPGDVHPAGGPQTRVSDTEAKTPVGGGPPEDARQGSSFRCGHPKVCRDPRLDGICPTEEGDKDVGSLLTNVTAYPGGQHLSINR